jgi:hypothetical protein
MEERLMAKIKPMNKEIKVTLDYRTVCLPANPQYNSRNNFTTINLNI